MEVCNLRIQITFGNKNSSLPKLKLLYGQLFSKISSLNETDFEDFYI